MARSAIHKPKVNFKVGLAVTTALASVALAGCSTSAAPRAEASYSDAQVALRKGKVSEAVSHAQAAVLAEPRNPSYRAALGAAYLEAGRFQAAATSFSDAIELGDSDPRTVLSYALAQTALGNNAAAVSMLDEWQGDIDPADLGLALSLAGQPDRGVHVLANALRDGQNTAKVRQNLAYSYALQGNWRAARVMAAEDVPANMIDDRIGEWAQTAHFEAYQARVANLLQVQPVVDGGQPRHLALVNFPSHQQMVAEAAAEAPVETVAGEEVELAAVEPEQEAPVQPAPEQPKPSFNESFAKVEEPAAPSTTARGVRFVSRPVVQEVPTSSKPAAKPVAKPSRVAGASSQRRMASTFNGDSASHLVQLGSFSSRAYAERAWDIYLKQYPELDGRDMVITKANVRGKTYYRVSAAGFGARSAANMCRAVKAKGAGCFAYAEGRPLPGAVNTGVRVAAR
ncbi:MAG TPA: SPOR domain-containing protein [Erythrobacter sp.]|nr:SPOR domain-containing protein [Erythrobacter sp.]